jgi:DNA-binding transcriptional MerR regulator
MLRAKSRRPAVLPSGAVFTSGEVAEISGVSLRQLQWWDEQNVVSPKQDGHRRVYEPHEVVEVSVIAELRRKGFSLQRIRRVVRYLHKEMSRKLGEALLGDAEMHLLTDGKAVYLEDRPERIIDVLKAARQPMFLVCVTDQVKRLTAAAERKPARSESGNGFRKARAV